MGDLYSNVDQKGQNPRMALLGPIWLQITHMVYKIPPQTIYFWKLLIEPVILSYKTSKSNNFEKMTYNEKFRFSNWSGGVQK